LKTLSNTEIQEKILALLSQIGFVASEHVKKNLGCCLQLEEADIARDVLSQLLQNIDISAERNFPLCQDTGLVVFWVRIGREVNLQGIDLDTTLNEAVSEAYSINNYRHSVVSDPMHRQNTGNNCPPIIHYELVNGGNLEIDVMLKGAGSENMSALKMLNPSAGIEGIRAFVLDTVKRSGGNACPPLTVGVGIGGNFETVALLAKKALFGEDSGLTEYWQAEQVYLLDQINKLGIGPLGLGGISTAIKVNILVSPCHIASLPVAVNLECHAHRIGHLCLHPM